jgi:hypothetical protein
MKNALPCIFIILLAFLVGCKKEVPVNTDPFAEGTEYVQVYNYTIVVKNDTIVSIHYIEDSTQVQQNTTIQYLGDSIALITLEDWNPADSSHYTTWKRFYLNSNGFAESLLETDNNPTTGFEIQYFVYDTDGYLQCVNHNLANCTGTEYQYVDGNFNGPVQIEYSNKIAKLDLFSFGREMDNHITGMDDINLPVKSRYADIELSYYYQFDSNGYVTGYVVVNGNGPNTTLLRRNYTYTFIQ